MELKSYDLQSLGEWVIALFNTLTAVRSTVFNILEVEESAVFNISGGYSATLFNLRGVERLQFSIKGRGENFWPSLTGARGQV